MTTSTTTPAPAPAPPFSLQPAEGWTERGQRAVLYLLTHGEYSTFQLDDETVEAAYHGAGVAATGRQLPADVCETLAGLQRQLRGVVERRQLARAERDRRLQALFDAADGGQAPQAPIDVPEAPQAPQAGNQGGQGGGGSKVPRTPKPSAPSGPAAAMPIVQAPAAAVFVPVPALAAVDASDLF